MYNNRKNNYRILNKIPNNKIKEASYEFIKSVLGNFSNLLNGKESREQKKLLYMVISEIIVNELRKISSVKFNLDDNLINYLNHEEGVSLRGMSSFFILRNIDINKLNLDIEI